MKICKIMRGVPGSGKSHFVRQNFADAVVLSTDYWFMVDGVYVFDRSKLGEYHNETLQGFVTALMTGYSQIVVDNTNIKVWEIAPYYRLAECFDYEVEIVYIMSDPALCKNRNTHGVPAETIDRMFASIEPLPQFWHQRIICNL